MSKKKSQESLGDFKEPPEDVTLHADDEGQLPELGDFEEPPEDVTPPVSAPVVVDKEDVLKGGWEKRVTEDGTAEWVNLRDFKTKDGAVPAGAVRNLEEAYALEVQRLG